jgi:hypothetical protein
MTVEKVTNPKNEKPKIRCKCGNKERFEPNNKKKTIDCLDCGNPVILAVEDLELYRKLGGK